MNIGLKIAGAVTKELVRKRTCHPVYPSTSAHVLDMFLARTCLPGELMSVRYQAVAIPCSDPNCEIHPCSMEFSDGICARHLGVAGAII